MHKVNKILLEWRPGDIHGLGWLRDRGIDQRLAYSYFQSGILRKIGPGVFARAGDEVNPYGAIRFLQEELNLKLHVSGKTALELHGHSHFISGAEKISLYLVSYESRRYPKWLGKLDAGFRLDFRKSNLFAREDFLKKHYEENFELCISSRELAILELIEMLDHSSSIKTTENYMQSLLTLRADVLQRALEECRSVKVKRVFLYIAEKIELPVFRMLKLDTISLGSGKRVVVKGGVLDKRYEITVDR
jgi:hypothetical protein